MLKRRLAILSGAASVMIMCSAHVGSPDTFFDGRAGPYALRVIIRSPTVIPARAEIIVRTPAAGVRRVTATARVWNGGARGAPPAETLVRIPGDSTLWSVPLWIMRQGSYAVVVQVEGAAGTGVAIVPFTAVASSVLVMDRSLAVVLGAVGLFLAAGLVTISGATAEATLDPGLEPDVHARRTAKRLRIAAAAALVLALLGMRVWWIVEDRAYTAALYRPAPAAFTTRLENNVRLLRFTMDSAEVGSRTWAPLVPDHGKLVHLFLVKAADLGGLAHLHPVALDSLTYEAALPPLPAGRYHAFADVVRESGFAETFVQSIVIEPPAGAWIATDPDDSYDIGEGTDAQWHLEDGSTLSWDGAAAPHVAGADAALGFTLRNDKGTPIAVEPYMGMAGHAVVMRHDGAVFVHLHPGGTASMGAQQALMAWTAADTARGSVRAKLQQAADTMTATIRRNTATEMTAMSPTLPGVLNFPYAFPKPGRYRVWVQFRHDGAVRTAIFDVTVSRPAA